MRLLNYNKSGQLCLTQDIDHDVPSYAILSHTWGPDEEEVTLEDIKLGTGTDKEGFAKIRLCGEEARKDGLSHFWVDTCCIDQTNPSEVQTAIVSMFRWYRNAAKCYAYLSDVTSSKRDSGKEVLSWVLLFQKSRWFTRGWTLQELLAPKDVIFYSRGWQPLRTKSELRREIHQITGIPLSAIDGANLSDFSIDERLGWAVHRHTKKPEDKWYCLLGIFGIYMPVIYGEGEHALLRLKDEIAKDIRRRLDNLPQTSSTPTICRRWNHNNGTSIVSEKSSKDNRQLIVKSLAFEQMYTREYTVQVAHSKTCSWFLDHPAFENWIYPREYQKDYGLLWVCGKPGAGKSTLMKFALRHMQDKRSQNETVISFFFNARGEELERSTIGMYRSLLSQMFDQLPQLRKIIHKDYRLPHRGWSIESLQGLFSAAVRELGTQHLRCFVDALDECDVVQVRAMVDFFEDLIEHAPEKRGRLFICFASRHYPAIVIRYGTIMILQDEAGHKQDLVNYIARHLRAGSGRFVDDIKGQILEKAEGIFMWVFLVIPILNREFENGRIFAVQEKLKQIPAELNDLFTHILTRDVENMVDFRICLQSILFAKRPLRREEFYYAMVAGQDNIVEDITGLGFERPTVEVMTRFVSSCSKGLAELTNFETPTIQFIHESVRDFLILKGGLAKLWPESQMDLCGGGHEQLKRSCYNYLTSDYLRRVVSGKIPLRLLSAKARNNASYVVSQFPFIEYATENVLYHADEASKFISQKDFIEEFAFRSWTNAHNMLASDSGHRYTSDVTLLYALAESGHARLIRQANDINWAFNTRGQRYGYPLFAALAQDHRDAVRALLERNNSSLAESALGRLSYGKKFSADRNQTPLLWALKKNHIALARFIISNTYVRPGTESVRPSAGPVIAHDEYIRGSKKERQNTGNPGDVEDGQEGKSVDHKLRSDRESSLLPLNQDANVNAVDRFGNTALHFTAINGDEVTLQMLLDHGVTARIGNRRGETALHYAAENGFVSIVQLLLQYSADINTMSEYIGTALHCAALGGHLSTIQMLLENNADVNAVDKYSWTVLHCAALRGHLSTIQLLLKHGADVNAVDSNGRTALHYSAQHGHLSTVQLLLEHGTDINALDKDGEIALHRAASRGHLPIVQMLLDHSANRNAKNNNGYTALDIAIRIKSAEIIQLLREQSD